MAQLLLVKLQLSCSGKLLFLGYSWRIYVIVLETGIYQSYENYDYFMDKADEEHSNHCSMVRMGATPPFAESAVMHLSGWRLDKFDRLPQTIKDYVATQGPEWKEAPTA